MGQECLAGLAMDYSKALLTTLPTSDPNIIV